MALRRTVLGSGVRVVSWETRSADLLTGTVGLWVPRGSMDDPPDRPGLAHFAEHVRFKGTRSLPTASDIDREVEGHGASLHAFTSRDQTCFYARCLRDDTQVVVGLLSEMVLRPRVAGRIVEAERDTVVREMAEVDGQAFEVVLEAVHQAAFGEDSQLGHPILGTERSVLSGITRDDVLRHVRLNRTASELVLVAAGPWPHERLVELARKHVEPLTSKSTPSSRSDTVRYVGAGTTKHLALPTRADGSSDVVHGAVAWPTPGGVSHIDHVALTVAQCVVGGHPPENQNVDGGPTALASRLLEKGATTVQGFYSPYRASGVFGVHFAAPKSKSAGVASEAIAAWKDVNARDVGLASKVAKRKAAFALEGTVAVCEDLGRQSLFCPTSGRGPTDPKRMPSYTSHEELVELFDRKGRAEDVLGVVRRQILAVKPCVVLFDQ